MIELLVGMVEDPEEAWWVVYDAMNALRLAPKEKVAQHLDRLAYWLNHEEWWLRNAAMTALMPLAVDNRYYAKVLPMIGRVVANNKRACGARPVDGIVEKLQNADPEVQALALQVLSEAYEVFPCKIHSRIGHKGTQAAL